MPNQLSFNALSDVSFEEQLRKLNLEQFNADVEAAEELSWLKNACELRDLLQSIEDRVELELQLKDSEITREEFNKSMAVYNTQQRDLEKRIAALDAPTRSEQKETLNKFIAALMLSPQIMMFIWKNLIQAPFIASVIQKLKDNTFTIHDKSYKASDDAIALVEEKLAAMPMPVVVIPGLPVPTPSDTSSSEEKEELERQQALSERVVREVLGQENPESRTMSSSELYQHATHEQQNTVCERVFAEAARDRVEREQNVIREIVKDDFKGKHKLEELNSEYSKGIDQVVDFVLPREQRESILRRYYEIMYIANRHNVSPLEVLKAQDPSMGQKVDKLMAIERICREYPSLAGYVQQGMIQNLNNQFPGFAQSYAALFSPKPYSISPSLESSSSYYPGPRLGYGEE